MYFPHIDNIYSHRSTQRHKRKRFVSHYWDCRLKGRPPGTKKSTDPDKKKRKRVARERDLCDVKIKITEFFDQREYEEQLGHRPPGGVEYDQTSPSVASFSANRGMGSGQEQTFYGPLPMLPQHQHINAWDMSANLDPTGMNVSQFNPASFGLPAKKFYTFQRVNGNGGNGKGDGVAGPHKHSLEESDRVKKNSVLRWFAKIDKDDRKKVQVSVSQYRLYLFLSSQVTPSCFEMIYYLLRYFLMVDGITCTRLYTSFRCSRSCPDRMPRTSTYIRSHATNVPSHTIPMNFVTQPLTAASHYYRPLLQTKSPSCLLSHRATLRSPFFITLARSKMTDTNQGGDASKKTYHKKATGNALTTVKSHSKDDDLKLYGSAFW